VLAKANGFNLAWKSLTCVASVRLLRHCEGPGRSGRSERPVARAAVRAVRGGPLVPAHTKCAYMHSCTCTSGLQHIIPLDIYTGTGTHDSDRDIHLCMLSPLPDMLFPLPDDAPLMQPLCPTRLVRTVTAHSSVVREVRAVRAARHTRGGPSSPRRPASTSPYRMCLHV
jgi:hypothetical protein